MLVNQNSLKKIGGRNTEFLVYGLEECMYFLIYLAIEPPLKGYFYNDFIDINPPLFDLNTKKECKNTLVNLIFENYKRIKENRPIILLLFSVALEGNNTSIKLNSESVAQSHATSNKYITDSELRRFYKMCSEMDPDISAVAKQTIKFIKVRFEKDIGDDKIYSLEEVAPIWENNIFKKLWQERRAKQNLNPNKPNYWKDILMHNVHQYNLSFFKNVTANKSPSSNFSHSTKLTPK